jgi:excinuclease ABC subunit C
MPRFPHHEAPDKRGERYFGPFAFASQMRKTLHGMRSEYGILLADASPTLLEDGHWKLYDDIRAELYGHANVVTEAEYRARVEQAIAFLEGESRNWLEQIRGAMREASAARDYEKAAELRDLAAAIERTLVPTRKFAAIPQTQKDDDAILEELRQAPRHDAASAGDRVLRHSHISGTYSVASMVHFRTGGPTTAATGASGSRASSATTIFAPWRKSWGGAIPGCATRAGPCRTF